MADPSTDMCMPPPPHTHTPPEPEVQVITDCGQQHELAGEGGEVVMEEEDSREQEVGEEVDQPPDHQHTPTGHPTLKLNCVCVCLCVCVCEPVHMHVTTDITATIAKGQRSPTEVV